MKKQGSETVGATISREREELYSEASREYIAPQPSSDAWSSRKAFTQNAKSRCMYSHLPSKTDTLQQFVVCPCDG